MPVNKEETIWGILKEGTKKISSIIETWFEEKTLAQILFRLLTIIIAIIGAFGDTFNFLNEKWTISASRMTSIILIVLLMGSDVFHTLLAKKRLRDLHNLRREYMYGIKLIRRASEAAPHNYEVAQSNIIMDIDEAGNVFYEKKVLVDCKKSKIPWAIVHVGVVDGSPDYLEKMHFKVIDPRDNSELAYTVIEETPTKKRFAILLNPIDERRKTNEFKISLIWHAAFEDLVEGRPDSGKLSIENFTKRIKIAFIAPRGIQLNSLWWEIGKIGNFHVHEDDSGKSSLIWEGKRIKPAIYPYTLSSEKKK